jgi:2-haloalkanoic acid dehalogenase type II
MHPGAPRHAAARRVDEVLSSRGLVGRVHELPDSTRTALDAARAVRCEVGQIVKSLVFRSRGSGEPLLVLVSGANRVDEAWMARYTGSPLTRAGPEDVRSLTGFAIGGVPPVGHTSTLPTYIDLDLLEQPVLWAAAGHPNAVFRLTPTELLELTRGHAVAITPAEPLSDPSSPWVSFDCYGTLVDWKTGILRSLREATGLAEGEEAASLFRRYLVEEQRLERGPYRRYREVMAEALLRASRAHGLPLSPSEAAALPESVPTWPTFPDTNAALDRLSARGIRWAVLSNMDDDLLEQTLVEHGLHPTLVVSAEQVRAYKPALAHWVRFLRRSGVRTDRVWHASGGYEYDIPPAAALGLTTVYVARYGSLDPSLHVDRTVRDLDELADARLSDSGAAGDPP